VRDQLQSIGQYIQVGQARLAVGVHTLTLRYPGADLSPGSGAENTLLSAIVLAPLQSPTTTMIRVSPAHAVELCGRSLDWIEVVRAT
jgi:hypothetical protein